MEKIDFSVYTVKGLQAMAKDAGLKGLSSATRVTLNDALASADLSKLDLGSYAMMKPKEDKPATKPEASGSSARISSGPRRSTRPGAFGRR